jgi:uncharacterized protein (DUF1330 family)
MPKGYWVVHVTVRDPELYPRYLAADKIAFDKYGARFLVRGSRYEAPEGEARSRHVVIEFDSYEKALACYHSPEYQEAARIRQAAADAEVLILEGLA